MKTTRNINIFFCIGYQKTGTTILARMLDQHPEIACIWESYLLIPWSEGSILNPTGKSARNHGFEADRISEWVKILKGYNPQSFWARAKQKITGKHHLPVAKFREVYLRVFDDFAKRCRAKVVGDKWPWYIDYIETLVKMFPKAKYIYNVRDPRGLWNSAQKFKGRRRGDELLKAMLDRDDRVSKYLDKDNFITIRYEDLICEPENTCKGLYEFLGCDFSQEYLRYNSDEDPYPDRWNWVKEASQPLDLFHIEKWKSMMSKEEINLVTNTAKGFMKKYKYEPSY
jgi:hypothetical protein